MISRKKRNDQGNFKKHMHKHVMQVMESNKKNGEFASSFELHDEEISVEVISQRLLLVLFVTPYKPVYSLWNQWSCI